MNPLPPAPVCSAAGCAVPTRHDSGMCGLHLEESAEILIDRHGSGHVRSAHHLRDLTADRRRRRSAVTFYRTDGPGLYEFRDNGTVSTELYFGAGLVHRAGGPARVEYGSDGEVTGYTYRWRGKAHRLDGPAEVRLLGGEILSATYFRFGKIHRIDGPAATGHGGSSSYYFRDERYDDLCAVGAALSSLPAPDEIESEVRKSSFVTLLDAGVPAIEVARGISAGCTTAEGIAAYLGGAPVEWVRSFEEGAAS